MSDERTTARAIELLDRWLEGMRGPHGYTGPISHWWESNFIYTGTLYDWRYEGIIDGYRELYERTGVSTYLDKAVRAADEVVRAQLDDGRFKNSSFQFGPVAGGTPHEAAVDVGLLRLAQTLQGNSVNDGTRYLTAAARNLDRYWIGTLWHGNGFWDQPYDGVLVANKHGTVLEALLLYEAIAGCDLRQYQEQCVEVILRLQVPSGPQAGGTIHAGIGLSQLAVPIYTARAMSGLLRYWQRNQTKSLQQPLRDARAFLSRSVQPHGVYWGIYPNGLIASSPTIVAGAGDLLRFFILFQEVGLGDCEREILDLTQLLVSSQLPSGGIPTAKHFTRKGLTSRPGQPVDFRDVVPVVGWVDKAFRGLALTLPMGASIDEGENPPAEYGVSVTWRGRRYVFSEDHARMRMTQADHVVYEWEKGSSQPSVCNVF